MTHRLATNYAKNYCNRTPIVKVIAENVVTCFLGHSVVPSALPQVYCLGPWLCFEQIALTTSLGVR